MVVLNTTALVPVVLSATANAEVLVKTHYIQYLPATLGGVSSTDNVSVETLQILGPIHGNAILGMHNKLTFQALCVSTPRKWFPAIRDDFELHSYSHGAIKHSSRCFDPGIPFLHMLMGSLTNFVVSPGSGYPIWRTQIFSTQGSILLPQNFSYTPYNSVILSIATCYI